MKRQFTVKASTSGGWYVGEPSSSDYGRALSEYAKSLKTKYEPFVVRQVYFNSRSANSSGYVINLECASDHDFCIYEWYFHDKELIGPAEDMEITRTNWYSIKSVEGQFSNLNQAMSYLFTKYSDII